MPTTDNGERKGWPVEPHRRPRNKWLYYECFVDPWRDGRWFAYSPADVFDVIEYRESLIERAKCGRKKRQLDIRVKRNRGNRDA